MLTSNKNPRFSYLRRLLVLPLAAVSLVLFSFKYKEIKDKKQHTHFANGNEEKYFDDQQDSTKKQRITIRVSGEKYKGSLIETIVPTDDGKGVVINTADGKSYFLNRQQAAEEMKVIITDSGFISPAGAALLVGKNWITTKKGAFVQTSSQSNFPQYQYTIDTTTYGLSKAMSAYSIQGNKFNIDQDVHVDIDIVEGHVLKNTDVNIDELKNKLIIVDGVQMDLPKLKGLDLASLKSIDVLKGESATAKYGKAGREGAILITTKANGALSGNPLYVLDGIESTKEIVDHILPANIKSVAVLKGDAAIKAYGEKGKNGVVQVFTSLAKNEVTFPYEKREGRLAERVVIGRRINTDSIAAKTGAATTPAKQPELLKDVGVVGYQTKQDYEKVFTKVDNPASFPGGLDSWRKYLERNLQYPKAAQEKGTQGTVKVQMVVDEDGNITELKALNDPGNGLAAEAERVIAKGPKWLPAKQNGHPVTYRFVQNLTFQLQ